MPPKGSGKAEKAAAEQLGSEGIDSYELPKAIVTRLAKSAVPSNCKLQKETILSLLKGSTVFINYLAATAHHVAVGKQHKSISASDVLRALELIEFSDLVEPFQAELQIYRELAKTDKGKKGSASVGASGSAAPSAGPSPSKSKLKAKAKGKAPATATPSVSAPPSEMPPESDVEMDQDENTNVVQIQGEPGDEEEAEEDEGVEEDEDEEEQGTEDEAEELQDTAALEEHELRKDAQGLEEVEMDVQPDS